MITLALCGDVMLARGIDQILPHPSRPKLHEGYAHSALTYVELAERVNGPIPRSVDYSYIWGDALPRMQMADARIINLETSVTTSDTYEPKGINYRMHPRNIQCLQAADINCCVLSNNHVLDWGEDGLLETLDTLETAGIPITGAGKSSKLAAAPAVLPLSSGSRVLIFGFGSRTSGIPSSWAASPGKPGVNLLHDLSLENIGQIEAKTRALKQPGDIAVASIHWGPNWGYDIPRTFRDFAHALIDQGGFDVVHGHSSHHPQGIEVYRNKLIIYGAGDFINDYEGIGGYEQFRGDLTVLYLPRLSSSTGNLESLTLAPFQMRRFCLNKPSAGDLHWLRNKLDRESRKFGAHVALDSDGLMKVMWTGEH